MIFAVKNGKKIKIADVSVKSDWNENNPKSLAFIKNKPKFLKKAFTPLQRVIFEGQSFIEDNLRWIINLEFKDIENYEIYFEKYFSVHVYREDNDPTTYERTEIFPKVIVHLEDGGEFNGLSSSFTLDAGEVTLDPLGVPNNPIPGTYTIIVVGEERG